MNYFVPTIVVDWGLGNYRQQYRECHPGGETRNAQNNFYQQLYKPWCSNKIKKLFRALLLKRKYFFFVFKSQSNHEWSRNDKKIRGKKKTLEKLKLFTVKQYTFLDSEFFLIGSVDRKRKIYTKVAFSKRFWTREICEKEISKIFFSQKNTIEVGHQKYFQNGKNITLETEK